MALSIVILAAGQGKRMHSSLPKVLHRLGGKALLERVINTALKLSDTPPIVIYGHQGDMVRQAFADANITWIEQTQQLGTGHAVREALPNIPTENRVLILYGDVPLISVATLKKFIQHTPLDALGIITANFPNPAGFGRIIRNAENHIQAIVEDKDAKSDERLINEINSGIYLAPAAYLKKWLPQLTQQNAQQEFYLTDIIHFATQEQISIESLSPTHYKEVLGVNDKIQLAELERFYQYQMAETLMQTGVTLYDPNRIDIRGELITGKDVIIDVNVIIEGQVTIGNHCVIGPNTVLRNVTLGNHIHIYANCVIEGAHIADHCKIGPFARIRPNTSVSNGAQIGNFIEIKNSLIGDNTKIHHVGYIGDSELGQSVNIGAGTITCNYDGANKHKTIIGDHAFIGSNSELIAPVTIGEGATIGAGSTIRRDAPPNQLTISRRDQRSIPNWQRKPKEIKES